MLPSQAFERRQLNQEIELAYIAAARAAAGVETKMAFEKGAVISDAQDFYTSFTYLIRLTIHLREMKSIDDSGKIIDTALDDFKKEVEVWKALQIPQDNNKLNLHLKNGLKIFDLYYKRLMHHGIIALPTKKG